MNMTTKIKKKVYKTNNFKNNFKKTITNTIVIVVVLFIVSSLSAFFLFKIKRIEVLGTSNEQKSTEIVNLCENSIGKNLIFFDSTSCKKNIEKSISYIDSAKIRKKLPNTLLIEVSPAVESGIVKISDDSYAVLSQKGKNIATKDKNDTNLPLIKGIDINETNEFDAVNNIKKDVLYNLMNNFIDNEIKNITEYDISSIMSISVMYDNRIKIILGNMENLDYKILTAAKILEEKIDRLEKGTLDVSSSSEDKHSYFTPN